MVGFMDGNDFGYMSKGRPKALIVQNMFMSKIGALLANI
jgi:hypothetical protein